MYPDTGHMRGVEDAPVPVPRGELRGRVGAQVTSDDPPGAGGQILYRGRVRYVRCDWNGRAGVSEDEFVTGGHDTG